MKFKTPEEMRDLITGLAASPAEDDLAHEAANALEQYRDVVEGLVLAAKRLGLGDVYGVLRSSLDTSPAGDSRKIILALDLMNTLGVSTSEPDLDKLLDPEAK